VVVPGDDAAPDAVHATLDVVRALGPPVDWITLPDGDELAALPRDERTALVHDQLARCDTALFGATSGTTPGLTWLRWGRGTYANVRPARWRAGVPSPLRAPEGIDYVIVRENVEGAYLGLEGDLGALLASGIDTRPWGGVIPVRYPIADASAGRYAISVMTREGIERVAHFACRLAQGRWRRVTTAAKWNVLPRYEGWWRETVAGVVAQYPDLEYEERLADDLARRLVASPQELDVVLLPNLYGDILSDEAAATIGGLGMMPSACYGDDFAYFEPVHGSAPDLRGTGAINPVATMLSAAMLLEHLGLGDAARRFEKAIDGALAARDRVTPDLGGTGTARQLAEAVTERL
jgi:isocitrate/isopropylmalate dehydrogenase